ncbi:MAG TPA: hypothetical protein VKY22_14000 [Bradyrhizobium sp.]|nr:hypothetical protein [Bradyrhizobium sp.]
MLEPITSMRVAFAVLVCSLVAPQPSMAETPGDMLAAQIRLQGFVCDKAVGAHRDSKRSRPDRAVWVLTCSNASYRVSRAPDMAATVEPLQ